MRRYSRLQNARVCCLSMSSTFKTSSQLQTLVVFPASMPRKQTWAAKLAMRCRHQATPCSRDHSFKEEQAGLKRLIFGQTMDPGHSP